MIKGLFSNSSFFNSISSLYFKNKYFSILESFVVSSLSSENDSFLFNVIFNVLFLFFEKNLFLFI